MQKINARPNLNGNDSQTFRDEAQDLKNAVAMAEGALNVLMMDVFHGRNYQHCLTHSESIKSRDRDLARVLVMQQNLKDMKKMADQLMEIAAEYEKLVN